IIAGYHTEYSSMRFGLFFLAEYLSVFAVSCVATVLFLGGGTLIPFVEFPVNMISDGSTLSLVLVDLILVGVFLSKVLFFIFVMFWVRATLPRVRVDRLMNFAWKYLVPLAIVNLPISAVWYEMVIRPGGLTLINWIWGFVVTLVLVVLAIYLVFLINRKASARVPLGSEWPTVGPLRSPATAGR
ncbi:MAG: NADH-quinone oxidoreductase subunit H, partial [Isosphaeraceae bacterium]